jgi:hypothetical protein
VLALLWHRVGRRCRPFLQEFHKTRGMCCGPPRGTSTRTGFQLNAFCVVNVGPAVRPQLQLHESAQTKQARFNSNQPVGFSMGGPGGESHGLPRRHRGQRK